MAIVYLYFSLFRRITEIFRNHTRNLYPESNAEELISFYELIILANISFKTQYSVALFVFGFIIIGIGNYYLFRKLHKNIIIPNNKIYKSKALLNTLFLLFTFWFSYSFISFFQKIPIKKEEIKYYQPLPPNVPKIETGIERYYNN